MSMRTARYIQLPKLKSFLTSCRRAKSRCESLIFKSKPRRWHEDKRNERGPALAPQRETPAGASQAESAAPESR